jgi:hypothetical protein
MEILSCLIDCPVVYSMATTLISRPWDELKRHLLHSFAGVARLRLEANLRLSQLKFDRDLMANRIRSLYDWFSLHDSSMSCHEFTTRVFCSKVFPPRYLEKIIERAEVRYPGVTWRRVPVWQLCDIVDEVCLLFAEFESVNPRIEKSDSARRVNHGGGAGAASAVAAKEERKDGWLQNWCSQFGKVFYVTDEQVATKLIGRADDSRRLFSRRSSRPYYLIGFRQNQSAENAVKGVDQSTFRDFELRKPLN